MGLEEDGIAVIIESGAGLKQGAYVGLVKGGTGQKGKRKTK